MSNKATKKLYKEIRDGLPASHAAQRRAWAKAIVQEDISLQELSKLMTETPKLAERFLWLLSDVGEANKQKLVDFLPWFFDMRTTYVLIDYTRSFCRYWHLYGVPEENEGVAIDLCFRWLNDPALNVSVKYHSMKTLEILVKKYSELKEELRITLEDQLELNTPNFRKQALKVLKGL